MRMLHLRLAPLQRRIISSFTREQKYGCLEALSIHQTAEHNDAVRQLHLLQTPNKLLFTASFNNTNNNLRFRFTTANNSNLMQEMGPDG